MINLKSARVASVWAIFLLTAESGWCALPESATTSNAAPAVELRLSDYLQSVLHHNDALQAQMIESEGSRRKSQAERGIFEPQLEASALREANRRTNNIQQQASLSGQTYFDEQNNILDTGVESLLPTGAKVRLGYTLSDLGNNVNPYGNVFTTTNGIWTKQYQTFVGATFTQPLLKNGGFATTMAALRLAAVESDIAFQQYRRQLMLTLSRAELAYWNLYFAQEQMRFLDDSVAVAQGVLDDSQQKLKTGQGAELDVMEAQSGLALRQTKRNEALQNYYEALGNLQVLRGDTPPSYRPTPTRPVIRVVDLPPETNLDLTFADGFQDALTLNPDFLIQAKKLKEEELRVGVAHNQLLPELNLKTAYGYNGLGSNPGNSWDLAQSQEFPSWSVGLELIVPLGGNIKGRNLLGAAKLSLQEAYTNLRGVQTEIGNHLDAAIQKTRAWHQSIQSYQTVVHFNEELLKTQVERLKAGTIDGHKTLEVEADLLDAQQELANALVQYQRAIIDEELTSGAMLRNHSLEITQDKLKQQTSDLVKKYQDYNRQFE